MITLVAISGYYLESVPYEGHQDELNTSTMVSFNNGAMTAKMDPK